MKIKRPGKAILTMIVASLLSTIFVVPAKAELIAQPALSATVALERIYVNQTTAITVAGGAGTGLLTYSTPTSTLCSVSATGVIQGLKAGVCLVKITKAADATYAEAQTSTLVIVQAIKAKVTLKKYKSSFLIYINLPNNFFYDAATVQIGSKKNGQIVYGAAEVVVLNSYGNGVYISNTAPLKGSYYRVMLGKEVVKAQRIR